MKKEKGFIALIMLALVLAGSEGVRAQGIRDRELLGVRVGGIITSGALHKEFGDGSELEIYFMKGLTPWLGVNVALSSHSFGPSNDQTKDIEFTGLNGEVDLHFWSVAVGMIAFKPLRGRVTSTIEAGPGIYSVNTLLPQGFYEAQKTDNRFGVYGGAGILIKISNSFSLNVNGKYHYVFVPRSDQDTIHFYTGEKSARFYQIAIGVAIYTG